VDFGPSKGEPPQAEARATKRFIPAGISTQHSCQENHPQRNSLYGFSEMLVSKCPTHCKRPSFLKKTFRNLLLLLETAP
jgi:hypothetical protein